MRRITMVCCVLLFSLGFAHRAVAQDEPKPTLAAKTPEAPAHYYHLDIVVRELGTDGKPTNSRTYTATVSTDARTPFTQIRTNSRVPVPTGSVSPVSDVKSSLVNTEFQYMNAGVNIDVNHVHEVDRSLGLELTADVSSFAPSDNAEIRQPVVRENRWQSGVLIPIGKPTVVFTSDALDSKGSMQVVVTATPLL